MALGEDSQWDVSRSEQDKIRRRIELKNRLKAEGVRKRYDPYRLLAGKLFDDPAIDRYMDLRKRGRCPNTPFKPSLFFGMVAFIFVPIYALYAGMEWERKDWIEAHRTGDFPLEKRPDKFFL